MLDFEDFDKYRENNRIEAKRATGGMPHSLWETYSSFANTVGGILLLGVEEWKDHSLHIVGLPDAQEMVWEFWQAVNDPERVSTNILRKENVQIVTKNEKKIVVIEIPRADRHVKPVYLGRNPYEGSYRRNGEGDYHCAKDEVDTMLRDRSDEPRDLRVLQKLGEDTLDVQTVERYRARMRRAAPNHAWLEMPNIEFLKKTGAVLCGQDGTLHPTEAGLLMFGGVRSIGFEFPGYSLDYREKKDSGHGFGLRILSGTPDWSGNLFDFYEIVSTRLEAIGCQAGYEGPIKNALCEALANTLVHADYRGISGIVVEKSEKGILFQNPGGLRITPREAVGGGISDPRNAALISLFTYVRISSRTGGGLSGISRVWKEQGLEPLQVLELFVPDRTVVKLPFRHAGKLAPTRSRPVDSRQAIVEYLTDKVEAKAAQIAKALELKPAHARDILKKLEQEGLVAGSGLKRNRIYFLKR